MTNTPRSIASHTDLEKQVDEQRRKVDFDTFDITMQEMMRMIEDEQIDIAPAYQRQYRWDEVRASHLIESVLLGIPIPSIFMATNADNTWELVDGLQRLTSVAKFFGSTKCRAVVGQAEPLVIDGLSKLSSLNGYRFDDLPTKLQQLFRRKAFKVVTLSDKSDRIVRFDLFERLNRGGLELSPQEIRHCVLRGEFADFLESMSSDGNFRAVVRLNKVQEKDATREECVLRFFSYLYRRSKFDHLVDEFLTQSMATFDKKFNYSKAREEFESTFAALAKAFPSGLRRPKKKTGTTSLVFFEGVAVGAALALQQKPALETAKLKSWLADDRLNKWTTGATNNKPDVKNRIEFCRDHFLGQSAKWK